ncbi:hypothetical protein HF325_003544 [Metschnikowia pulcherrima]|uniref:Uncharacterized protein n=1 Tax=Metschnikowia pulcherrima TaxID=27326 RepID=A0A8H7LBR9_9ASCO|nr:hypothetical protein HF325_003544 [Metschnikowia pulcherrima]
MEPKGFKATRGLSSPLTKEKIVKTEMGFIGVKRKPSCRGSTSFDRKDDSNVDSTSLASFAEKPISAKTNPFEDPVVEDYYRQLYESSGYECRAAFDPDLEWTEDEEKALRRKLMYRVTLTSAILFFGLQVDRSNLSQAVSDNLLEDLGLTTDDYNLGNTLFLISFLIAEIPSQLISKAVGPDLFIPFQMVCWSTVAMCQAAMKNKAGFLTTRILLGLLEGGFIADIVLWISYFYTSKELPMQIAYFWTSHSVTSIVTSLLAFGILRMRGVRGMAGWRWLFIIEGAVTLCVGIWSFYAMVPSIMETRSKLNPKGWFTEREEKIAVNRILRDDPSKGDMNNRQALSIPMIWRSFSDYDLWPLYIVGFIIFIPLHTVTPYMTLTLKHLGFSTFNVNLLTIPYAVIKVFFMFIITWASERLDERSLMCTALPLFTLPFITCLRWWPGSMYQPWPTWVMVTMILSAPYIQAICIGWVSRNSNSIRSRSVGAALFNVFGQLGSIAASNIYRADDRPLYRRGNLDLFIITLVCVPLLVLVKVYYMWRNSQRDEVWNSMSHEEQENYVRTTKDQGNKRLDFRFEH